MEHNASVRGLWAKGHFTASSKRSIQLGALAPPSFWTTFELLSLWRDIFEHPFYSTLYPIHLHNRLDQMLKYWFSTFLLCQERGPSRMWWIFWPQSALDGAPIGLREHKTWSLLRLGVFSTSTTLGSTQLSTLPPVLALRLPCAVGIV